MDELITGSCECCANGTYAPNAGPFCNACGHFDAGHERKGKWDDLITFLNTSLDERAASAEHIHDTNCDSNERCCYRPEPCNCGEPDRVLCEVEASRRIVAACESVLTDSHTVNGYSDGISPAWLAERTLKLLALPYSEHPAYRP